MNIEGVLSKVEELSKEFGDQWYSRKRRKHADPNDFERLQSIGMHVVGVPVEFGGLWKNLEETSRPMCDILRVLACGDSSVALVCAMHQLVLSPWRIADASNTYQDLWMEQRRQVFDTVIDGKWWGTIVSEPGSGGDTSQTQTIAIPAGDSNLDYYLTGLKHFGSGSGITGYMITVAVPVGGNEPDLFWLKVQDVPWDGSTGMKLIKEWDSYGMSSTDSHTFEFKHFPATRVASACYKSEFMAENQALGAMAFTAVIVGTVDAAMAYTRQRVDARAKTGRLRAFEHTQWVMAEQETWLVRKAYEGGLRAIETGEAAAYNALMAKENISILSESILTRLCRISGGGSYTRDLPLAFWFEDVRALGFLRPPWSLAFDRLFEMSWLQ